jgi:hypothetical protein
MLETLFCLLAATTIALPANVPCPNVAAMLAAALPVELFARCRICGTIVKATNALLPASVSATCIVCRAVAIIVLLAASVATGTGLGAAFWVDEPARVAVATLVPRKIGTTRLATALALPEKVPLNVTAEVLVTSR